MDVGARPPGQPRERRTINAMNYETLFGGALRAVGLFYAAGSLFVLWGTLATAIAERAQADIEARPMPAAVLWRTRWLVGSALLLFMCGLALALLLKLAVPLFMLSMAGQTLYLLVLAPRYFDPDEEPDAAGRQGSRNAALVFSMATAFVLMAGSRGWLQEWRTLPPAILASAAGLVLFTCAYAASNLRPLK
jgi:hypothetical protein